MKQQSSKIPSVGDEAYVYDKNGNMIEDKYKKIYITYNYLNLPLQIEYKSGENNFIHFVYSATGEKLQKIITVEGKVQSKTDYINGIEYKNDVLQRIAHTEGSLSRQDDDKFLQEYVLRDHLGNTRVTFTDADNDGNVNEKDIKQINMYYPFGLNAEGNWNGAAGSNKYQYNGKSWEDDFGLGWNDYGARFYDPAGGRWLGVDPLAESYSSWSPYNYTMNNPIKFIDPDGMGVETRVVNLADGKVIYDDNAVDGNTYVVESADGTTFKSLDEVKEKYKDGLTQISGATVEEYSRGDVPFVTKNSGLIERYIDSQRRLMGFDHVSTVSQIADPKKRVGVGLRTYEDITAPSPDGKPISALEYGEPKSWANNLVLKLNLAHEQIHSENIRDKVKFEGINGTEERNAAERPAYAREAAIFIKHYFNPITCSPKPNTVPMWFMNGLVKAAAAHGYTVPLPGGCK